MSEARIARFGRLLCLAGALLGAVGLLGWLFGLPLLTTIVPGQPAMMPNTSVSLLLIGVVGAIRSAKGASRAQRVVALLAALFVLFIAGETLAEYVFGTDLGIDQLIIHSEAGPYPGRMSPPTALALFFLAAALIAFDFHPTSRARPSEWMILVAGLISLIAITGMLLGAAPLYRLRGTSVIGVALPTAISIFLTSSGLLLERPRAGFMRVVTARGPGGIMLRRLVLPSVMGPVVLALVVRQLYAARWIEDISLAIAILAIATTVIALTVLVITAALINKADAILRSSEHEQRFLATIGEIFAGSLDLAETLKRIATASVEFMADFVILDLVEAAGLRRMKVAYADPAKAEVARLLEGLPPEQHQPPILREAISAKKTQVLKVTAGVHVDQIPDAGARSPMNAMDPCSLMFVPLIARDEVVGVLTFISSTPGKEYKAADVRLAEEVARRAAVALDNARLYRMVQDAIEMRDTIMGIVAHDLRNPLSAIFMNAELARQRAGEPAAAIERAANRMNRLIQDLLDVTTIEAGRLSIEQNPVHTAQVVTDSVEAQRPLASSTSHELRTELATDLPDVWADHDRLLQVFENLIGNALKFTAPGGRITIGAKPRDGEVLFWVADTGSGIPAEEVAHIFDRFWQARKPEWRGAGLGLGLPIVKGLVEAQGGHVWVESTPGKGSTFYFTIPEAPRAEKGSQHWAAYSPMSP